jgi:hypothetical protein
MTANTDKVEEKAAKELERMKACKSPAEMEKEQPAQCRLQDKGLDK